FHATALFLFHPLPTPRIYPLSLHDALPISSTSRPSTCRPPAAALASGTAAAPPRSRERRGAPARGACDESCCDTSGGMGRATLARFTVETRDRCGASHGATHGGAQAGLVPL